MIALPFPLWLLSSPLNPIGTAKNRQPLNGRQPKKMAASGRQVREAVPL
jgi:hypothetical protein